LTNPFPAFVRRRLSRARLGRRQKHGYYPLIDLIAPAAPVHLVEKQFR
jgi:hypothetical protein